MRYPFGGSIGVRADREADMSRVDMVLLAVLALSVLIGLLRGLTFEVLALLGWLAAYFAAQWFAPLLAPYVPLGAPGSALNYGAAFVATFVLALIAWAIVSRLVTLLVKSSPLRPFDRVLGAGFGLLRGLVVLLALATAVAFTPWEHSPAWQSSQGAAWLKATLQALVPVLPNELSRHLPV
jgi:membrane protein required for colicin V production